MDAKAKELHDAIKAQPEMFLILGTDRYPLELILRALSLLASVEGSAEEIVRDAKDAAFFLHHEGMHNEGAAIDKAAARIVSDAQEKERLRAELASVKAHAEAMERQLEAFANWREKAHDYDRDVGNPPRDFCEDVELIESAASDALDAYRSAHPKDAK